MSKWVVEYKFGTIVFMSPDLSQRSYKECEKYVKLQSNPNDYKIKEFSY